MWNRFLICLCSAAALVAIAGCDSSTTSASASGPSMEDLAAKLQGKPPEAAAAPAAAPAPGADAVASDKSATPPTGDERAASTSVVPPDAKVASDRGPVKSRPGTYFGAISAANRNIRTRLDDLPWKESVKLFEAEKGYKPRNTQEFLERVRGEGTPLPDIDPGTTYLYVPDEGQFGELYAVPIDEAPAGTPPNGR
jgi:hypothetical protein